MKKSVKSVFLLLLLASVQGADAANADESNLNLLDRLQEQNIISTPQPAVFEEKETTSYPLTSPTKIATEPAVSVKKPVIAKEKKSKLKKHPKSPSINKADSVKKGAFSSTVTSSTVAKKKPGEVKKQSSGKFKKAFESAQSAVAKARKAYSNLQKNYAVALKENKQLKAQLDTLKKQSADENKKFNDQIRILNKQAAEKLSASETAFRKSQDTNQATKSALQKSNEYNKTLKSQLKDAQTAGQKALEDKEKITQELTKTKKELMSLSLAAITKKDGGLISDEVLRIAHSKEGDKTVNSYSVGYILGQAADTKINQVISSGEQVDRQIVIKGFVDRMNRIANMSKEDMTVALDRLDKSIKRNEATAMAAERRSLP